MTLALTVGILMAGCAYLVLQRGIVRVILGFVLLSHAAHLTIMATGGTSRREPPMTGDPDPAITADALPQAFVLTAIVISFAMTVYLLVLAVIGGRNDESDVGDLDELTMIDDLTEEQIEEADEIDEEHLGALEDRSGRDVFDGGEGTDEGGRR